MSEYKRNKPTAMDRLERDQRNYIACELASVNSTEPHYMRVQFQNPDFLPGTKWLNITQAQFKEIERILTLGTQGEADARRTD